MSLTYKRIKDQKGKKYVQQLAQKLIHIEPQRIHEHHNYMIYHADKRIGFVSCQYMKENHSVYIYMLAFEEHAQHHGHAHPVLEWLTRKGSKKSPQFRGLTATVHKDNQQALDAVEKYGFIQIKERRRYVDFLRPVD